VKNEGRYQTAAGLRMALEERLNRMAQDKGMDVQRLRRQVAFDRFLGRLSSAPVLVFILKGGYALELRLDRARATKDIDLSCQVDPGRKADALATTNPDDMQDRLQIAVAADCGDFIEFIIGKAAIEVENAPAVGWRFPVEVRMAGRVFIRFAIDVAVGDPWLEPHELVATTDWLGFAGIGAPRVAVIAREQQFAEKLHAYTRPRRVANSRVKDLVDLLMLGRLRGISSRRIRQAAEKTFSLRGTHPFPPAFPLPSPSWNAPFRRLARECGIEINFSEAVDEVSTYCERLGLVS
jgi:hypothetical protein